MTDEEKEYIAQYVRKKENLDIPLGVLSEQVHLQFPYLEQNLIIDEMVLSLLKKYEQ